jgi:hypothetical protein
MTKEIQIDSLMTLEEALSGTEIPQYIRDSLVLIDIYYVSFDGLKHQGQLVVHKNVAAEVVEIFHKISTTGFPIHHAIPIVKYHWDDESSMLDNNTSAFNYRVIHGTEQISNHSLGLAIDINPLLNPCNAIDGSIQPANGTYDPLIPGTIRPDDEIVSIFTSHGWRWLGHRDRKDWQHFDKANAA